MSAFSDLAFQAAMAAYLVALVCYGIELASRRGLVPTALEAASMQRRVEAKAGVGVTAVSSDGTYSYGGGGGVDNVEGAVQDRDDDDDDDGPRRPLAPWGVRFGRAAVVVTGVGVLANAISVVTRGLTAGRLPLANLYEFSLMLCLASVTCWLIVLWKTGARPLGLFVMTPVALLAFIAGTVLWIPAGPVMPSLNSYWKWIHVTTVSISGSVLLVSGAASVMYLLRHRFDRKVSDTPDDPLLATSIWGRLPSLQVLDKIAYRTAIVAFPLYTFAVIAGSLWAEVAWGKYWSWDPKETVAFVSWVFYAGYLHARATSGWRGVRSAWINIFGFAAIVFNLFFVNFVISGLHSYAMPS